MCSNIEGILGKYNNIAAKHLEVVSRIRCSKVAQGVDTQDIINKKLALMLIAVCLWCIIMLTERYKPPCIEYS